MSYTEDDCSSALQRVADALGKSPFYREYQEHRRDDEPSYNSILEHFETWGGAKRAAGLDTWEIGEDECISALRRVSEELGENPYVREYTQHRRDDEPSKNTVISIFGSWNEAKEAAELDTWSVAEGDCISALQRVADVLGKSPTVDEYAELRDESEPSKNAILNAVGSWNEAKEAADLDILRITDWTRSDCISTIHRVAEDLGKSPSLAEYEEQRGEGDPSTNTIEKRFGTWNEAKAATNLEVYTATYQVNYTEGDCISALQRVTDIIGKSPSRTEYDEHRRDDEPCGGGLQKWFNSWNEAKRMADLAVYQQGGEGTRYSYGSQWEATRSEALDRHGCSCASCGMSNEESRSEYGRGLDVHHLHKLRLFYADLSDEELERLADGDDVPEHIHEVVEERNERANHVSNLVPLCRACHRELECLPVEGQVERLGIEMPEVEPVVKTTMLAER